MSIIKVFNVFVDSEIIVGIGPLLKIQRVDPMSMVFYEMTFKFDLYCKYYIIPVTTDPLSFPGKEPSIQADSEKAYTQINKVWELICRNMKERIPLDLGWENIDL